MIYQQSFKPSVKYLLIIHLTIPEKLSVTETGVAELLPNFNLFGVNKSIFS